MTLPYGKSQYIKTPGMIREFVIFRVPTAAG